MGFIKLKPEISPYYAKFLSPRYHITRSAFEKIIKQKEIQLGCKKCESCDNKKKRIELHESFSIRDNGYHFEGFYFLCAACHDLVHFTHGGTFDVGYLSERALPEEERIISDMYDEFDGMSVFKSKKEFCNYTYKLLEDTFYFNLSEKVFADYSAVEKYGLSPTLLETKFNGAYNPFEAIMQYLIANFQTSKYRYHKDISMHNYLYSDKFDNPYEQFLHDQYLKHHEFFVKNKKHIGTRTLKEKSMLYALKLKNNQ